MTSGAMTTLPASLMAAVSHAITDWEDGVRLARLWAGEAALWTGADEGEWLGWLRLPTDQSADLSRLQSVSSARLADDFDDALLVGMGGSSLCPDVFRKTFRDISGALKLHVLDSTDPAQILACERRLDLSRTLFIVSSKSGTTLESNLLFRYFFHRVESRVAHGRVGERFIAVTDPGSSLDDLAREYCFREVFHGRSNIGGRYSALSDFGIVPAAAAGIDVDRLLARAAQMQRRCDEHVPVRLNPGAMLGLTLGVAALTGRDKLTLVTSQTVAAFGGWVEQLVAESTGKEGRGIIPIEGERLAEPDAYPTDRVFVQVRDEEAIDPEQDEALDRLAGGGHPVLRISLQDRYDIAAEFFRWEFATAVMGALLHVNPFDQPDVEASKAEARALTQAFDASGALPAERPLATDVHSGLAVFADAANATVVGRAAATVSEIVTAHCARLTDGDYFGVLAYIEMNELHATLLQELRHGIRDATGNATCVGFGPRFLHSTGQAHKGGPNTGVFLQITCDDEPDVGVPGESYTFGAVKAAQAQGDLRVLGSRGRKAIRVHISGDLAEGLREVVALVNRAVGARER